MDSMPIKMSDVDYACVLSLIYGGSEQTYI